MFEYQALQRWNNPCHTPTISSNELQQKDTYDINMLLNVYIVKSTYKFSESSIQLTLLEIEGILKFIIYVGNKFIC